MIKGCHKVNNMALSLTWGMCSSRERTKVTRSELLLHAETSNLDGAEDTLDMLQKWITIISQKKIFYNRLLQENNPHGRPKVDICKASVRAFSLILCITRRNEKK